MLKEVLARSENLITIAPENNPVGTLSVNLGFLLLARPGAFLLRRLQ